MRGDNGIGVREGRSLAGGALVLLLVLALQPGCASPEDVTGPPPADRQAVAAAAPGVTQYALPASPTDESKVPHYFGPYPNWANSPYTLPDVNVTITGDGTGATAAATVGADGAITGLTLTDPGLGYTSATVEITGAGSGAAATATVTRSDAVTAIVVTAPGAGYTSPTVTLDGGGATGTPLQVGNALTAREYATDYATPPGTLGPVFVVVPAAMPASGLVQSIQYFNQATPGGSPDPSAGNLFHAYVLHATGTPDEYTVLWDSGLLTVPATADPVGEIVSIPVPDIAVTTGDALAFYGEGIPVDVSAGVDLISYPALVAPVVSDILTLGSAAFPLFSATRTYSFGATVLDTSTAVTPATATVYGGVDAVTLLDPGAGYTMPTVDFDMPDDPAGVQAEGHAECVEVNCAPVAEGETVTITGVIVDQPGSGYATAPNVVIRNGTQFDPIAGSTPATAVATLRITAVVLDTFGGNYTSVPTVTFSDPTGTGAAATAVVNTGAVTSLVLDNPGSGYVTGGGIKKFTDPLPGLCLPPACPSYLTDPAAKYIPLAVSDPSGPYQAAPDASDSYEIGLVQYRTRFSSSLPPTLVRGYVQLETPANAAISQHYPLVNELQDGTQVPVLKADGVTQWLAVTPPQWLGPTIVATRNRAARIVFRNLLPTGSDGDLFLPVDSTMMGSGMGPMNMTGAMDEGTVMDEVRNPMCSEYPKSDMCFKDNRATLHLHGGITPWISDGTPHQWVTPAGEPTQYPQGVTVQNVPDMNVCNAADDGCMTFYYTNQQSARLMFYHDHAWGITRLNVYAGEAAGYLITDDTEQRLIASGAIPAVQLPLVIQDRTFVPDPAQLAQQDPTWDSARWGTTGNFWYHHVYMPAQNPGDPSGMSSFGRWMYGPWFWPPARDAVHGPIDNPYYDPQCVLDEPSTWQYQTDPFCEPALIPGTPNISAGMEQFNDTPIVNGVAYPTITLEPKAYRLRVLNAANDRFWNLQWYLGDSGTANPQTGATEVALKASEVAAAQTDPVVFPTPDLARSPAGPDWIQIGTEGGFLPAPVVVDGQQVTTWITDPTRFDVGNVDQHSLLLAPAERADVIVDFSRFAGQTLILYNDAPAAFPARVPQYDYYTGAPDLSPSGAPTPLPGYGPNTRTVMQVKIANVAAAPAFDLTRLRNAFKHSAAGTGAFESGQHPIIVGQAGYNTAYGTDFVSSGWCNSPRSPSARCDGYARISEQGGDVFYFNTLRSPNAKFGIPLQPKAIHDEMNSSSFDEFGRMTANLGVEAVPATPGLQNVTLYPYVNPATELLDGTRLPKGMVVTPIAAADDGTQIWKFTHNGVDTHPIHFHLYDVQVLNRVTWDNIIIPPDATELGWKDTVRMSPLEDTIVALRPVVPALPFEIPNSVRPLNPMMPLDSTAGFNSIDPNGNPTAAILNKLVNFGWEYVVHCHILSHEEMDMMRPETLALPPVAPDGLAYVITGNGNGNNRHLALTWNDNSITETSFEIQRTTDGTTWSTVGTVLVPLTEPNIHQVRTFNDPSSFNQNTIYQYRVLARNTVGYGNGFPTLTVQSVSPLLTVGSPPAAPTGLAATLQAGQAGPQVNLAWTDNANNESGFVVERAVNGGAFTQLAIAPPRNNTGGVSLVDATIQTGASYSYRVRATNLAGVSAPTNTVTVVVPATPAAPSGVTLAVGPTNGSVIVAWTDNASNETGFTIQWARNSTFTSGLDSLNVAANTRTVTVTGLRRSTLYFFRIRANNGTVVTSGWVLPSPPSITTR